MNYNMQLKKLSRAAKILEKNECWNALDLIQKEIKRIEGLIG